MSTRIVLTYEDYAAIPADGRRYEVHDGELSVTPAPSPAHQRVVGNLFVALRQHVSARGLGEVLLSPLDCILSDTTVVQPDLVYLETGRRSLVSGRGIERHRVPTDWIVDLDARRIEAYVLSGTAYRLGGHLEGSMGTALPPFAELELDPAAVWP